MGRRKKEPQAVHRAAIAAAAQRLFTEKGTQATTMDEIAREAGYSKATLYVYFQNKEEIIAFLVLESMKLLYDCLRDALATHPGTKAGYRAVCEALTRYQASYPAYFSYVLGEINTDLQRPGCLPVERETFEVGERINAELAAFLRQGMQMGTLRKDLPIPQTVFLFWAALSGLIQMAANKQVYLEENLGISKCDFMQYGFETLYRAIAAGEETS